MSAQGRTVQARTAQAQPAVPAAPPGRDGPGLGEIARSRDLAYGAAAQGGRLVNETDYARAYEVEAALLVPEYEGKWAALQPTEGRFDFGPLETLTGWATAKRKAVRGHALVWHQDLPAWTQAALAEGPRRARGVLEAHMTAVLARTRTTIRDWDVVNEPVADPPGSDTPQATGELRDTPWLRALGPTYPALALRLARERDPTLRLVLNEYGVEEEAPHCLEKRRRLLALVRAIRKEGAPLDAVGMQAHLQMDRPFDPASFTAFCQELRAEGLELLVTELDMRESWQVPEGYPARDKLVAERIKAFTEAALAGGVKTFLTWGLRDVDSWLVKDPGVARKDGLHHRGLPLDWEGNRKPFWEAMANAFRSA
ncbi:endo-1,4-beta-xylanase [Roseomonas sp. OT10]|uniref:endo-1,4-beta-xylanase n=1 Tax=Roseomonas cutis TaxID=2897332 RepID=UPI001E3FB564|nr:endo-1,4-beta-xylanase [Roseomonas sp. OT10]UFN46982.1 endo-1,4-beta-xylanase [Roseomonas sp. OT10]